jgi:fatty acid amide hydrolase 2
MTFKEIVFESADSSFAQELARALVGKARITAPAFGMILTEMIGKKLMPARLQKMADKAADLQRKIEDKLGSNGILLSPPFAVPAPKHGAPWFHLNSLGFCAIFNILEFPGTIVPVRWTSDGLPVGVLLTGARMADHLTIAAAKALEEEFGGWRIAPVV